MIARAPNWQQICGSCEESSVCRELEMLIEVERGKQK